MLDRLKSALQQYVMANVPPKLPPPPGVSRTQVARLTERQISWCDERLPNFKGFREAAERARAK